jgi:hypothetical protein
MADNLILIDGSLDWSSGVNSTVVTTVASDSNPNGLKRTAVAWMDNCTVRDGGITQRFGWNKIGTIPALGQYQGSFIYVPDNQANYHIVVIDGHVWKVPTNNPGSAVDLSAMFGVSHPITDRVYFCQAEIFLIIQAGDDPGPVIPGTTDASGHFLPLIWDGNVLRRSKGITDVNATSASPPHTNEIPAATAMCYYMGRVWYAQGRSYSAGDIVGGPTGTLAYDFRDSVLCVQENPLCAGGDGFMVPSNAGNIRGIAYASNINSQLGQGILYIGTREEIYSLTVPVTRTDWIGADANNQPLQVVALSTNGWVNDRSIVAVNGDLFFQCLEPSIRSLTTAIRNFQQWGNVPISINENRLLQFTDRSKLWAASGIYFDNRLLQTGLPFQCPVGVAHQAIIPLNFDVISTLDQQLPPVWEGMLEGMSILELTEGDYGGDPRAFATVWSEVNGTIELWELTNFARWDNDENHRVIWYIEFPAFTFGSETELKKLVSAEIWIDRLVGKVLFRWDYRPDGYVCWYPWIEYEECSQANNPGTVAYPQGNQRESYRQMKTLSNPPIQCAPVMGRPSNTGFQFQVRLTIKGFCRVRGLFLKAEPIERKLFSDMVC